MKKPQILFVCILVCLLIPAVAADVLTAKISVGPATTESPPEEASVYIQETKAAVAGQNWTAALLFSTRGVAWYPDNADLLCLQGYTYRKLGQYEKSVDVVSKGIRLDPKPVRYANRGYGYLALRNYPAALADAETGILANATYPATYGVKALALQGMGRNTGALTAIDQALALDPKNAHYWHVKGVLLTASGDCTGAREALEMSIELDPGYNLPYPGFTSPRENLATLKTTCIPSQEPAPASMPLAKSSDGGVAVVSCLFALLAVGTGKQS